MDDGKPQGEYPCEGQTDTNVDCRPESLESLLARLDVSALKLTVFVKALQALNGRVASHLYGHDSVVSEVAGDKRDTPSLVSLNDDFDTQLEALGRVVESLIKHVGPFEMDRAEKVPVEAVGPGSDAYRH